MKIGFCGLGQMGKHMAANLARKSGAEVIVCDVRGDSFAELERVGATTTTDLSALSAAGVIFLSLPNAKVVQDVLFGQNALAARLRDGQIVVDTSTITYGAAIDAALRLQSQSVAFLDAPISGMEARAKDGTLTIMCGGSRDVFDKVKPYLDCIGSKVLHLGRSGAGQLTKLINQLLFDINIAAVAEILPMAMKMQLDPAQVAEVVNNGTGRSYASEFFLPRILKGHFSDGYPLEAAYKDLVSAAEIGANECIPMPILAAATATFRPRCAKATARRTKAG
jgi:3-hydroxyisobutyrate dehydrogenase-like beta-hydroxyacid dehydrogenase